MEERVGELWHKFISQLAYQGHPDARIRLEDMQSTLGVFFRALGGDHGLKINSISTSSSFKKPNFLQRLAGSGNRFELSWQDINSVYLPEKIDYFPTVALNRKLYLWLTALQSSENNNSQNWLEKSQQQCLQIIETYPGLAAYYQELVSAYLPYRPDPAKLKDEASRYESLVIQALKRPGSVKQSEMDINCTLTMDFTHEIEPVLLWPHPSPPLQASRKPNDSGLHPGGSNSKTHVSKQANNQNKKYRTERTKEPDKNRGLLLYRFESIFSHCDFVNLDRGTDNNDDMDNAESIAEDLDKLSISESTETMGGAIKFDLDLAPQPEQSTPLDEAELLPEWNYKKQQLEESLCSVHNQYMTVSSGTPLPRRLKKIATKLRAQFAALTPQKQWLKSQLDGTEIDMDAYGRFCGEISHGNPIAEPALYADLQAKNRDICCLLLADLSLSTDAWVNNKMRVIDIIQDSLLLFAESLSSLGDRFAIHGFSSQTRANIYYTFIKQFNEHYNHLIRSRIQDLQPGFYTRVGAAIRKAIKELQQEKNQHKILLLLTDGKPNDQDYYEGRYGIEDTRHAVLEAHNAGIKPFCVTIDQAANQYLPHLFGKQHYIFIRNIHELPCKLPLIYKHLT